MSLHRALYVQGGIFISYRREETVGHAGRLYDRLAKRFGEDCVFMDVEAIAIGVDYTRAIIEAVSRCNVLLVLIGSGWLAATDSKGTRRIDNSDDWVRIEIETALQRDILVVPVLIDGAQLPDTSDLPQALRPLTQRQALELRQTRFKSDSQILMNEIGPLVGTGVVSDFGKRLGRGFVAGVGLSVVIHVIKRSMSGR